jgi:hypothetical protein
MSDAQHKLKKLHNRKQLNKLLNEYGFSDLEVGTAVKHEHGFDIHKTMFGPVPALCMLRREPNAHGYGQYYIVVQFQCDYEAPWATYNMLDLKLVAGKWTVLECHVGDAVLFRRG